MRSGSSRARSKGCAPIDQQDRAVHAPFASLAFDDVELLPEYRLSGNEGGFQQLFRLLEFGRVFICASSVGMAQAAMEDAVAHARERIAFGKHISQFQQIEQMLTDMEVALSSMRLMLYRAVWDIENDTPDKRLSVALMKRFHPKTATEVASQRNANSRRTRVY